MVPLANRWRGSSASRRLQYSWAAGAAWAREVSPSPRASSAAPRAVVFFAATSWCQRFSARLLRSWMREAQFVIGHPEVPLRWAVGG